LLADQLDRKRYRSTFKCFIGTARGNRNVAAERPSLIVSLSPDSDVEGPYPNTQGACTSGNTFQSNGNFAPRRDAELTGSGYQDFDKRRYIDSFKHTFYVADGSAGDGIQNSPGDSDSAFRNVCTQFDR